MPGTPRSNGRWHWFKVGVRLLIQAPGEQRPFIITWNCPTETNGGILRKVGSDLCRSSSHSICPLFPFCLNIQHCLHIRINIISKRKKVRKVCWGKVFWEEKQNMSWRKALVLGVVIKYLFQIIIFSVLTMSPSCQMERYCWEIEQKIEDQDVGRPDWGCVWGQWLDPGKQKTLYSYLAGQYLGTKWLRHYVSALCVNGPELLFSF